MAIVSVSKSLTGSVSSDRLSAEYAQPDESGSFQRSALVAITNLAERNNTQSRIAISHDYRLRLGDALWIDGTDQLLVREREKSRVAVLDTQLTEVDAWFRANWDTEPVVACRRGDEVYVAAGTRRTIRREGRNAVDHLAVPDGLEDCRVADRGGRFVEGLSAGCRATLSCRRGQRHMNAVVDIADNSVVAWHEWSNRLPQEYRSEVGARNSLARILLFADGNKVLRQQEIWVPDPPGSTDSFRRMPGPLLRTVDAKNGQVLRDNARTPPGTVSRVFCRGVSERVIVAADRQVHLIDLDTLDTIASWPIPFDRPFVF